MTATAIGPEPLGAQLLYGACWEDLAVARTALQIPRGGVVVAVASAGDNAIGLLLDDPRRVVAVDLNPAQTALAQLKLAAVRELPGEVSWFVGGTSTAAERDPVRLARYEWLRPAISREATRYWDARPDEIRAGVIHAGRFERYLAWFRHVVLPVVPGRGTVRSMLDAEGIAEQRRIYRDAWDSVAWRALFRVFFSRRLMAAIGRHPAFFDQAPEVEVGAHFLARAAAGLTATPLRCNPYATFILDGRYRSPDAVPEYMRPLNAAVIAGRADRVEILRCSILDILRDLPDRCVDAFYLSDIFELASPAQYEETLVEIIRVGRPGARLCYWNNLVERTRPASFAAWLAEEAELAATLHARDRAFLYSRLVVEEVRPASGRASRRERIHAA